MWFLKQFIGFSVGRDPYFNSKWHLENFVFLIMLLALGRIVWSLINLTTVMHVVQILFVKYHTIIYYLPMHNDEEPSDVLRVLFNYINSLKTLDPVKLVPTGISSARDVYRRDQLSNKLIFWPQLHVASYPIKCNRVVLVVITAVNCSKYTFSG